MEIKIINDTQYEETAKMIERAVRYSQFSKFYPQIEIENVVKSLDADGVKKRASWTHFYVIVEDSKIIGCGAIGEYWGSKTESSLFSIFVDPEYQGKGYGRKIIETLEQDELFRRAKRIEIPASISAIPFYRKMGYEHKNGQLNFSEGHFALEKFNNTKEIIKIFKEEFPYINREEKTIKEILNNGDNIFIEKRDDTGKLLAISVINKNTILFFYVDKNHRNKGLGTSLLSQSEDVIKHNGHKDVVIGAGFDYIMPGVPTSKKYFASVNECLSPKVNDIASNFFEKRGYSHSWDCNCFDMQMKLTNFNKFENKINDTIKDVKYRWATLNDLKGIIDCSDDACQYQDEKFSKYYKNEKLYNENNNQRVLVAEKKNKMVGCIIVSAETESTGLGGVGCTCVRIADTHQGIASNMVILGTQHLKNIGLKNASLGYTYSGLDKMYGNAGYKISCYYMMATKQLH